MAGKPANWNEALEYRITVRVTKEQMERIEKMAEFCELPKTRMAHNLIINGLEQCEALKKGGFMHIAKGLIKGSQFLKELNNSREKAHEKGVFI